MTDALLLSELHGNAAARFCRGCGCHDLNACITGHGFCCWILLDLAEPTGVCSACAMEAGWNMDDLATMGREHDVLLDAFAGAVA